MNAMTKNIMIGIFVVIALAIIVFILLFLHPTVGDNARTFHVRFNDIDKVNVGTRVTYAGKPVGEVVDIKEIPEAHNGRIDHDGNVYIYELTLKVDSGVHVYNTDEISVKTSGLLGEKNVGITPRPLKDKETLYLIDNETMYATSSPSVEDAVRQIGDLSDKVEVFFDTLTDLVEQLKEEEIVSKISRAIQNVVDITDTLNQPEKWNQILNNVWTLSERVKHSWTTVDHTLQNIYTLSERAQKSWTHLDHAFQNLDQLTDKAQASWVTVDNSLHNFYVITEQFKQVAEKIRKGQGTAGQLLVGDDIYLRLKAFLHKGQTIADDMNRYGLLFHLNKDWQRLNARRQRLLQRLSTPEKFNVFFQKEMDGISDSLSRVSLSLSDTACYPQSLLCDPDFIHRFAQLLKQIEAMEDSLKIYNEQVIDQEPVGCAEIGS